MLIDLFVPAEIYVRLMALGLMAKENTENFVHLVRKRNIELANIEI